MVFSSLLFLFRFLPLVFLIYFLAPRKLRNGILFFSSLVFYAWGEPIYVGLMLFSTIVDFSHGLLVHQFKEKGQDKKAKLTVISAMLINLCLLGFFKYADFFIKNINTIFNLNISLLNLALPIGISFYTFQTMSYTVDVYRDDAKVQKNIISFGAYVALFPQLIAGPIVQFKTIADQLDNRRENKDQFTYGILRFISGLGKKVLLANNIGLLWDYISKSEIASLSVLSAWIGITAFAFQIYFDFSGYSDMAIGLGSMFGFTFLENFDYPYMSKSITEFWRRWHISLGTWFRDYVYIPLGGNRRGFLKQIRNILIVWLLTGFWHGASWNFVIWGLYFGIILMIEKVYLLKLLDKLPKFIAHIYTLLVVLISWVIFAFDDLSMGVRYLKTMFAINSNSLYDINSLYILSNYGVLLFILILVSTNFPIRLIKKLDKSLENKFFKQIITQNIFIGLILFLCIAYLVDASYNPFLYFRF